MTFAYGRAAKKARSVIAKFGQTVTITRTVAVGADPTSPETPAVTTTTAEALAAVLPVSPSRVGMGVGDTVISADDVTIYAAHEIDFPPQPNDQIATVQGTFRVIGVSAIAPAGTTVAYEITGRR